MLRFSALMTVQVAVSAVGGLVTQAVVNTYPIPYIAGYTATNKLYGLLEFAALSYGYAITTYTGQNYGAGNIHRVRRGRLIRSTRLFKRLLVINGSTLSRALLRCGNILSRPLGLHTVKNRVRHFASILT